MSVGGKVSLDSEQSNVTTPFETPKPGRERGFWALIATQFQGAYSSNLLEYLLLGMIVVNLPLPQRPRTLVMVLAATGLAGVWLLRRRRS